MNRLLVGFRLGHSPGFRDDPGPGHIGDLYGHEVRVGIMTVCIRAQICVISLPGSIQGAMYRDALFNGSVSPFDLMKEEIHVLNHLSMITLNELNQHFVH